MSAVVFAHLRSRIREACSHSVCLYVKNVADVKLTDCGTNSNRQGNWRDVTTGSGWETMATADTL